MALRRSSKQGQWAGRRASIGSVRPDSIQRAGKAWERTPLKPSACAAYRMDWASTMIRILGGKTARLVWRLALAFGLLLAVGEIAIQLSGAVDVPIYLADSEIGYIPAPNQRGAFMRSHTWRFNEYSMGAGPFAPERGRFNLLLVGDSIVLGGNPLAEPERLGPQLEKLSGWQVWPVSAGSWALQNELTYLRLHPELLDKVDAVALVLNSGDFGAPSSWASELTHPLRSPFPGLVYVLNKYMVHPPRKPRPELTVQARDWRPDLRQLATSLPVPLFIFMYPSKIETRDAEKIQYGLYGWLPAILDAVGDRGRAYLVEEDANWQSDCYRDEIHPSAAGNAVLAGIIFRNVCHGAANKTAVANGEKYACGSAQLCPESPRNR